MTKVPASPGSHPIGPSAPGGTSTRPYLIRALHEWCSDNGFTPYLAVFVDAQVRVPLEYVKNNEIVLNVSFEATTALQLGNDFIEFKARFGGVSREIAVPVHHVIAIYARENGQGMAFPVPTEATAAPQTSSSPPASQPGSRGPSVLRLANENEVMPEPSDDASSEDEPPEPPATGGRPSLKRVK